jgi:dipeptidyl aminopeptidase/acylaminoacyl peptidase
MSRTFASVCRAGLLAVLAAAGLAWAAQTLAAPANDLTAALAMPRASGLVGAAQARRFAWIEDTAGVRNIWIGGPDLPARALTDYTQDDGLEISGLAWNRDGTRLAFVRGGDAEFPDGALPNPDHLAVPPKQEIFVVGVHGGSPKLVGEGHSPRFAPDGALAFVRPHEIWLKRGGGKPRRIAVVEGTVGDLKWSPDGKTLLFVDDRGDHAFVALYSLGTKQVRYIAPGLSYSVEPTFSPDGSQIAFIQFREPPAGGDPARASYWSVIRADVASGAARELWRAPSGPGGHYYGTRQRNLYWTADGRILFPWERTGWLHAYAIDARAGGAARDLTPGDFEVETFLPSADGRALIFVGNVDAADRHAMWTVPLSGGTMARTGTASTAIESYPALADGALAAIVTDASHPAHVVLADGAALGPAPVLEGAVEPQPVTYRASDGMLVHAQLFRGRGVGPRPAVVFVHGGPRRQMLLGFHPMGYYSNAYVMNQHLAAQGYTVLSVNYRSGTGYGEAFREAPGTARDGAAEYRDVLAGAQWLAARPAEVDPSRIGIWGGSWGGYLSALALARDSALFAAGVDFHGVHTMLRPVPNSLSPDAQDKARDLQWQSSPFGSLDAWRSPVLLIHGDDDRNVDFFQSVLLARELTARGVKFEELVFPDERHEFLRHADWLTSYLAAVRFLDENLKSRDSSK